MMREFSPEVYKYMAPFADKPSALVKAYLDKYWISDEEWYGHWEPLSTQVFCPDAKTLPDMLFRENFSFIPLMGGSVLDREHFEAMQACMLSLGEEYFFIIENTRLKVPSDYESTYASLVALAEDETEQNAGLAEQARKMIMEEDQYGGPGCTPEKIDRYLNGPFIRLKFPTTIKWEELRVGDNDALDFLDKGWDEFFIFGDSLQWGMYLAEEYFFSASDSTGSPLKVTGFRSGLSSLFQTHFRAIQEEDYQYHDVYKWLPEVYKPLTERYISDLPPTKRHFSRSD